jgi:hypothetical protein
MKTSEPRTHLLAAQLLVQFRNIIVPLSLVKVTGNRISQAVLLCELPDGELPSVIPGPAERTNSSSRLAARERSSSQRESRHSVHHKHKDCPTENLCWIAQAIPVTGRGNLQGCEMLRIPHCLDNRLTDGGRPRSTPHEHYFSASGTHFWQRMSKPQGLVRLEGLVKLKKLIRIIMSWTRDLPACNTVP